MRLAEDAGVDVSEWKSEAPADRTALYELARRGKEREELHFYYYYYYYIIINYYVLICPNGRQLASRIKRRSIIIYWQQHRALSKYHIIPLSAVHLAFILFPSKCIHRGSKHGASVV